MDPRRISSLRAGYDEVADEYVRRIYDELANKPFDRKLLDDFAESIRKEVRGRDAPGGDTRSDGMRHGPVLDVGCGPGHVSRYLRDRGVDMHGLDLSAGM